MRYVVTTTLGKLTKAITALLLISFAACHIPYAQGKPSGTQCVKGHPIACAIQTLQPALAGAEAHLLSNLIAKSSIKYNVDPLRVVAIIMQESAFKSEISLNKNGTVDVGWFQFNTGTIKNYNLDAIKLKTDIVYATDRACWLLREKMNQCAELSDSWSCYHSKTEKYRLKYIDMVNRHYNKIKPTSLIVKEGN